MLMHLDKKSLNIADAKPKYYFSYLIKTLRLMLVNEAFGSRLHIQTNCESDRISIEVSERSS